jgi:hypothetical protein
MKPQKTGFVIIDIMTLPLPNYRAIQIYSSIIALYFIFVWNREHFNFAAKYKGGKMI